MFALRFADGIISEVLSNGGTLPQLLELEKQTKIFTRRNGLIFSLFWFIFFVLILTPFWGIMDVDGIGWDVSYHRDFWRFIAYAFFRFFVFKPVDKN